jgi:hypothetical protein
MALVTTILTLPAPTGDKTRTAIEIDAGVGDAQQFMVVDGLSAVDLTVLETIQTTGVGATMLDKLTAFVLSNDKKAVDVYGGMIKSLAVIKAEIIKADVNGMSVAETVALYNAYVAYVAAHP